MFLAAALVCPSALSHELGTIRTYADFHRDGRFSIEIFIDREHLPPGFAATAALSRTPIRGLSASLERAPTTVLTNGTLIDEAMADALAALAAGARYSLEIRVSLDDVERISI